MDLSILKAQENGIEFFTIAETGESGLSTTRVARSLGVSQQSISSVVKLIMTSVTRETLPESLQPLWGKQFQLQAKYKNLKLYSSLTWACLADYYAHDAQKKTKEAVAYFK